MFRKIGIDAQKGYPPGAQQSMKRLKKAAAQRIIQPINDWSLGNIGDGKRQHRKRAAENLRAGQNVLRISIPERNPQGSPAKGIFQFSPGPGLQEMPMWIAADERIPDGALVRRDNAKRILFGCIRIVEYLSRTVFCHSIFICSPPSEIASQSSIAMLLPHCPDVSQHWLIPGAR